MIHNKKKNHSTFHIFLKYVVLNVIGMIGLSCYILADTIFIANGLGSNGLTALNLILPVFSFVNGLGLMFGMGAATRYSVLRSEGNVKAANQCFTEIIIVAFITGTILTVIGIFFPYDISKLLGANSDILPMAGSYLQTILLFSYAFLLNNVMICFIRNDGSPKLSMIAMLAGSLGNIFLDYLFIFPFGLGMFGAAFATGLSPIISLCILSIHIIKKKNNFRFIRSSLHNNIVRMLSLGIPSFITEFSSGIIMLLFNFTILNLAGNTGVAAYGIIANLALIVVAIFTGIAQGIQPLLSTHYGSGNKQQMNVIYRYAIVFASILGTLFYLISILFPDFIVNIFGNKHDIQLSVLAKSGMKYYFIAFLFMGTNIVTTSFFSSIEKPMQSFLISITRGLLAVIPFIILMPLLFDLTGVWLVIPLVEVLTLLLSIISIIYYRSKQTN